ncbi:MAG: response regulator transcription factor [Thermoleophilum sp.]|nr:response regulator transcription factor [Thermoleophilum sp.]
MAVTLAVLDTDSGFVHVLLKRAEALGWRSRRFEAPPRLDEFSAGRVNALVVDIAMFGPAGWDWLERVAQELPGMAVLVCTGRSTVAQRVRGLRIGADDWITKPCHPEEVVARVEAALRARMRVVGRREVEPLRAGELEIRPEQYQAFVAGRSADLTRREYELLEVLAKAQGRVLQREEIYRAVWGYTMAHGDRSVDVFVRKLRKKLEVVSPEFEYIHTHFGIGYRFDPRPRSVAGAPPAQTSSFDATALPTHEEPGSVDPAGGSEVPGRPARRLRAVSS